MAEWLKARQVESVAAPAMGPAVRGRRCRRLRKPSSPAPHRTSGSHSQRTRIPTDSRTRV